MERITEIQARLAEINETLDSVNGEELTALETESRGLLEELNGLRQAAESRQQLRSQIAAGAGVKIQTPAPAQASAEARAAAEFVKTRSMTLDAEQTRATLISSGKLAQPTEVSGINDIPGAKYSSIIDLVKVVNCVGMGTYRVAYVDEDAAAAGDHTEGEAVAAGTLGSYKFVDITPESVAVIDYISKQVRKQTPLQYHAKVREQALIALRRKAAAIVTNALKGSELNATVAGTPGKVEATTLRKMALAYGGDESVLGSAVLFLNKLDLLAFGDVRGTNEKKAVYEIIPDAGNPNTGVIKDGGLSVRYCLNSNLTAVSTAAEGAGATMIYGAPACLELGLFSDYEVTVSADHAIDKLLETIVGDAELGAGVTVKHGFVALTV